MNAKAVAARILVFCSLVVWGAAHAAAKIDEFGNDQVLATTGVSTAGPSALALTAANSDFANRSLTVQVTAASPATNGARVSASTGVLSANKDSNTRASMTIVWAAAPATFLNFPQGGHDSVRYRVVQNNVAVDLVFGVQWDTGGGTAWGYYQAGTLPGLIANEDRNFAWDGVAWTLNPDGTGGAVAPDWTRVVGFSMLVDSTAHTFGTDTQFELMETADLLPNLYYDLADAPDTYGTLRPTVAGPGAGPRHQLTSELYLGNFVDADQAVNVNGQGQPSVGADGDDTNLDGAPTATFGTVVGVDDEDGVNPADLAFTEGVAKTLTVQLRNTVGIGVDAYLVGWIDFNGNGVFDPGSNEEATAVVPNLATSANLSFTAPAGSATATGGNTYARFRLSTTAGLLPTGDVGNGEVEDYVVTVSAPPAPPPPAHVPVMGPWGLALLALLMPVLAAAAQRRRPG